MLSEKVLILFCDVHSPLLIYFFPSAHIQRTHTDRHTWKKFFFSAAAAIKYILTRENYRRRIQTQSETFGGKKLMRWEACTHTYTHVRIGKQIFCKILLLPQRSKMFSLKIIYAARTRFRFEKGGKRKRPSYIHVRSIFMSAISVHKACSVSCLTFFKPSLSFLSSFCLWFITIIVLHLLLYLLI